MKYYEEIKQELINNEITKKIKDYSKNKSDLTTYYNVGKLLSDAGKHYGEGIIKEYSLKLMSEIGKTYNVRTLRRMRQMYIMFKDLNWSSVPTELTISHYTELLNLNNVEEINYYINIAIKQNLSYRELRQRIKNNENERLPKETKDKLIKQENNNVQDFIKNPIIIKNNLNYNEI